MAKGSKTLQDTKLWQTYLENNPDLERTVWINKVFNDAADYDVLCRGYGADRVEEQVKAIREREEEQKRQRRMMRKSHSIGAM